jgi:hypothetical protein
MHRVGVWSSLAGLMLVGLWWAGFIRLPLVAIGLAAIAALFLHRTRTSGLQRPSFRDVTFYLLALLALGVHFALGLGYLLFMIIGARQASDADRLWLSIATAAMWLVVLAVGAALWLGRRWLVAGVPVASVLALTILAAYAQSLPAVERPPEVHRPTAAGVIAARADAPGAASLITLASGQNLTIYLTLARPQSVEPTVGRLLIAGQEEWGYRWWWYALRGEGDCFWLSDTGAEELGRSIRFSFGLELPKADGYRSRDLPSPLPSTAELQFCVNGGGEVAGARG